MARDGLLPKIFGEVNSRFRTPVKVTLAVGSVTALLAGFLPLTLIAELVNIGTLAAFIIVAAAVIVLRHIEPDLERHFRCPLVPWVPLFCIVSCFGLIVALPTLTHLRFIVWLVIGLVIYITYGRYHSNICGENPSDGPGED